MTQMHTVQGENAPFMRTVQSPKDATSPDSAKKSKISPRNRQEAHKGRSLRS